jgi:hypothetical protein
MDLRKRNLAPAFPTLIRPVLTTLAVLAANEAVSETKLTRQLDPMSFYVSREVGRISMKPASTMKLWWLCRRLPK